MSMEKRLALSLASLAGAGLILAALFLMSQQSDEEERPCTMEARVCPDGSWIGRGGPMCEFSACPGEGEAPETNGDVPQDHSDQENPEAQASFSAPLDRPHERVTKKPFGILIDPATSPVQPERFSGYHAGVDFETFPEEVGTDVPVQAICSGRVLATRSVSGYGGVVVTDCVVEGEQVTVLYGHLALASLSVVVGEEVSTGGFLGHLGRGYSRETDGERQHLHLSVHRGSSVNLAGYVSRSSALGAWLDPCLLLTCHPK